MAHVTILLLVASMFCCCVFVEPLTLPQFCENKGYSCIARNNCPKENRQPQYDCKEEGQYLECCNVVGGLI
ncbi:unnamed protein product [Ixodes pacificus]